MTATGPVLVLNSGSSSVKFAVLDPESGEQALSGLAEKVGTPEAVLRIRRYPDDVLEEQLPDGSHQAVISQILDYVSEAGRAVADRWAAGRGQAYLRGAGHRVVHGGERFTASVLVDDEVIAAIRTFSHLAPLHNPANLAGIEAIRDVRPDLPQVAVFDTAFHQTMPPRAFRYAVPEEWYTQYGVRRYGFHGTSYRYV
ncbi:MAG TPA: acetate kinase, partial [Streptosporangiaceae bacterium]|nr:acetate kinase [Streptosporangiaceae bacterium]